VDKRGVGELRAQARIALPELDNLAGISSRYVVEALTRNKIMNVCSILRAFSR